jgi:hypothetical protein
LGSSVRKFPVSSPPEAPKSTAGPRQHARGPLLLCSPPTALARAAASRSCRRTGWTASRRGGGMVGKASSAVTCRAPWMRTRTWSWPKAMPTRRRRRTSRLPRLAASKSRPIQIPSRNTSGRMLTAVENGGAGTVSRRSKMAAHNRAVLWEVRIGATAPITPPFRERHRSAHRHGDLERDTT